MAKMFLEKYFPPSMVTKLRNEITNFCQRPDESLLEAWELYKLSIDRDPNHNMLRITQIDTFYNGLTLRHRDTINASAGGTIMKRRPKECYDLIENMTTHHNDWDTSVQRSESSSSINSSFDPKIIALKAEMAKINKNFMMVLQINQQVKAVTHSYETCGGPHSYNDCQTTVSQTQNVYAAGAYNQVMNTASSLSSGMLLSNTVTYPKEDLKGITTRSGNAYKGPTIPTTSSPPKVVERETEPVVTPIVEPVPANDQNEKFFPIFQDLNFNISLADALILMPMFGLTIKSLLTNKEKLFELARTPLNEHFSAFLLKKLPEKLGDPGKFLIPYDFPRMDECFVINLMPLSVWTMLSLPILSPTCMTLEHADRPISRLARVAKDVFVKVGTFHFPVDFLVVDFDADTRVSLILRRSFLKTGRALIDVYEGELTLHVGNKTIAFNLDQTSRYFANYDATSVNRIDIIDIACKEYFQEVFGFSVSGNPTPYTEPIVSTSSPTLTPFGDSDFLLEETDSFLAIYDEPISSKVDDSYYDSEGDILFLEDFLNDDPSSLPLPPQELKVVEPNNVKFSIDEPPMVKLKDLPPHLEYAFLEGDDKLPIIIAKDLKDEENTALIKVLKSHKQGLAWQLSDIKEKSIAIFLAEESIRTVMQTLEEKQIDTEIMQELLLQLSKDLQTFGNTSNQLKQDEHDSSQYWKPPVYYSDDDDNLFRQSIDETPPLDAIAPDLPVTPPNWVAAEYWVWGVDYDCDIHYHPGKANVIANALSRKERKPPLRVRALVM
nr:reverse transcriptase domain-containing protein [Tanacetum cinerariifolium]